MVHYIHTSITYHIYIYASISYTYYMYIYFVVFLHIEDTIDSYTLHVYIYIYKSISNMCVYLSIHKQTNTLNVCIGIVTYTHPRYVV